MTVYFSYARLSHFYKISMIFYWVAKLFYLGIPLVRNISFHHSKHLSLSCNGHDPHKIQNSFYGKISNVYIMFAGSSTTLPTLLHFAYKRYKIPCFGIN